MTRGCLALAGPEATNAERGGQKRVVNRNDGVAREGMVRVLVRAGWSVRGGEVVWLGSTKISADFSSA